MGFVEVLRSVTASKNSLTVLHTPKIKEHIKSSVYYIFTSRCLVTGIKQHLLLCLRFIRYPILFAICTSAFSELCRTYTMSYRRALSRAPF
jgi:hypothetical protein